MKKSILAVIIVIAIIFAISLTGMVKEQSDSPYDGHGNFYSPGAKAPEEIINKSMKGNSSYSISKNSSEGTVTSGNRVHYDYSSNADLEGEDFSENYRYEPWGCG